MRELRCAWCSYALSDIPPPLPFLPNKEIFEFSIFACCWKCGTRFNVSGETLRERQVFALFYSGHPVQAYTNERVRAVLAYVIRRHRLNQKRAEAREAKPETNTYRKNEKMLVKLSRNARNHVTMYERSIAQAMANHEKLRKVYGEMPNDLSDKTFVELEIIIFGDASDEARALDAKAAQYENDQS
jgi:hypothetical protein